MFNKVHVLYKTIFISVISGMFCITGGIKEEVKTEHYYR